MHVSILRLLPSCVGVRSDAQTGAPTRNTQLSLASCKQILRSLSWVSDVPLIETELDLFSGPRTNVSLYSKVGMTCGL